MSYWIPRLLADLLGLAHVVVIAMNTVIGISHAIGYQKDGNAYSLWAGVLSFSLAYFLTIEHTRYRTNCARIFKDD